MVLGTFLMLSCGPAPQEPSEGESTQASEEHPVPGRTDTPAPPSEEAGNIPSNSDRDELVPLWSCRTDAPASAAPNTLTHVYLRKHTKHLDVSYEIEIVHPNGTPGPQSIKVRAKEGTDAWFREKDIYGCGSDTTTGKTLALKLNTVASPATPPSPTPSPRPSASPSPTPPVYRADIYEGGITTVKCDLLEELIKVNKFQSTRTSLICEPAAPYPLPRRW